MEKNKQTVNIDHDVLRRRLHTEATLSSNQVEVLFADHDSVHLLVLLDYVVDRYRANKVQRGKIAPYFLSTLISASPESLGLVQSSLDHPTVSRLPKTEVSSIGAIVSVERNRKRQMICDAEVHFRSLGKSEQESLRSEFMTSMADELSPVIFNALKQSKDGLAGGMGRGLFLDWLMSKKWAAVALAEIADVPS